MHRLSIVTAALCAAAIVLPGKANAGWLTIDNPPPSNEINMTTVGGTHSLTLLGLGSATIQLTSRTGSPFLQLRSYAYHNPATFSEFPANGLDPNGADQFVIGDTGGSGNSLSGRFDFSGFAGGVLPAGSIFTVLDLDEHETLTNLTGFGPGSSQIMTSWLQLVSSFDSNGATSGLTNSFPTFAFGSGAFQFTSASSGDIGALYFRTTQDLEAVSFDGTSNLGPRGYGLAFATEAVPEPGTFVLAGAALAAAGLLRRRQATR